MATSAGWSRSTCRSGRSCGPIVSGYPFASAALATAGELLFAGDVDRYFYAYDQATGKVLWRTRLNSAPESFPVTFEVNGRQYVAVVVGSGSPFGAASRAYVPEVSAAAAGVAIAVFELP